jgi:hypothetical protein
MNALKLEQHLSAEAWDTEAKFDRLPALLEAM